MSSQQTSTFLEIPPEIRRLIFKHVLHSSAIRIGFRTRNGNCVVEIDPNPRRTSILQTCRQIYSEVLSIISSNISFRFRGTIHLIDTLTIMPLPNISHIRNIRVKGYALDLENIDEEYSTAFQIGDALSLFPGLQLDRLVVEDVYHTSEGGFDPDNEPDDCRTRAILEGLIRADGWKEFHYITPSMSFILGTPDERAKKDCPQPKTWDTWIKERDGKDSGAEAKLYRAKEYNVMGGAEDEETRESWDVSDPAGPHAMYSPEGVMLSREVMVVVKRGRNCDYVNDGSGLDREIKLLFNAMSWDEIKESKYEEDWLAHI